MKINYTIPALFLFFTMFSCSENVSETKGSEKTIYSCPMHHEVREDSKGKCPKCGMDLVVVPNLNEW